MTRVTLAEALRIKSNLVKEINDLELRLTQAVFYKVNDEGKEVLRLYSEDDFKSMLVRLGERRKRLLDIKHVINDANQQEIDGDTVKNLITLRGELKSNLDFWNRIRKTLTATDDSWRYTQNTQAVNKFVMTAREVDQNADSIVQNLTQVEAAISVINATIKVDIP
jgi:hypothetical protein